MKFKFNKQNIAPNEGAKIRKRWAAPTLIAAIIAASTMASANGHFQVRRCSDDYLNQPQGEQRTEWAMRCSPLANEVISDWQKWAFKQEDYNPTSNDVDADGNEVSKRKYQDPSKIVFQVIFEGQKRIGFPSFGYLDTAKLVDGVEVLQVWPAPVNSNASCAMPDNVDLRHYCPAGCYTGDQKIWLEEGEMNIAEIPKDGQRNLMTLEDESTLDDLKFASRRLLDVISDPVAVEQDILVFKTANQAEVRVTLNHPLVDSNGIMRRADSLEVGDSLVRADGYFDEIVEIEKVPTKMRAYNVVAGTFNKMEKIVVAQGFLSGDLYYQNAGADLINRMIIREGKWLDAEVTP